MDMVEKQAEQTVTADMPIGDVIQKYPNTVEVFFRHGLGCVGCAAARFENIAQGAMAHGIDVDALMKDLNAAAT
jgi:hybrid cluster-associated redox disulfide protein